MNEDISGTPGQPPQGQPHNYGSQPQPGSRSDESAEPIAADEHPTPSQGDDTAAGSWQTPAASPAQANVQPQAEAQPQPEAPAQPETPGRPAEPGYDDTLRQPGIAPHAQPYQQPAAGYPQPADAQSSRAWPIVPPAFGGAGQYQQATGHYQMTGGYPAGDTTTLPAPYAKPQKHPRRRSGLIVTAALIAGILGGTGGAVAVNAISGAPATTTSVIQSSNSQAKDKVLDGTVEAVAKKILPSVVQINVTDGQSAGTGSGIILTEDGMILTNNHVVESAVNGGTITVVFNDGSSASATVVGRDPLTDVAVIKVQGKTGLTPATFANSDNVSVGQDVVAVGSPYGLTDTVTSGIVSALNRPVSASDSEEGGSSTDVYPAIQTDAPINPGNSGGPLTDMNGNIIGMNASIRSTSSSSTDQSGSIGLGFAIPSNLAENIANQIMSGNTVTHAELGVSVADSVASDGITAQGAEVKSVTSGSAASKAGLQAGDRITAVDGITISDSEGLVAEIRSFSPGKTVTLTVHRGDSTDQLKVTLGSDGGKPTS